MRYVTFPRGFLMTGLLLVRRSAAYGNPDAPEIQALRTFRERYLFPQHPLHQRFLAWYHQQGPPLAAFLQDKPALRALVRAIFTPAAKLAQGWLAWRGKAAAVP